MTRSSLHAAATMSAIAGIAVPSAMAQDSGQIYVQGHLGTFVPTQDGYEAEALGFENGTDTLSVDLDTDAGLAVGALAGYQVNDILSVEGEVTYRNHDASFDGVVPAIFQQPVDGDVGTLATMANAVVRMPGERTIRPYAGAGIGYVEPMADVDAFDGAFGYQVKAGVALDAGPGTWGLEASYLGTPELDRDLAGGGAELDYGGVTAAVFYRFNLGAGRF